MSLPHIGWIHILLSRLCLLVSWLSPGIPHGFEILYLFSSCPWLGLQCLSSSSLKVEPKSSSWGDSLPCLVWCLKPQLDIGDQICVSPPLGWNPPSRGLGTETPRALPMVQRWEHFFFIKFLVEYNVHKLATCLASSMNENCTLFVIWI
jgi:hypothetical protein